MTKTLILWRDRAGRPVAPPFEPFPEAVDVPTSSATHEVRQGETLRTLALLFYQDPNMWLRLAAVNRIEDPQAPLEPGLRLVVPPLVNLLDWTS